MRIRDTTDEDWEHFASTDPYWAVDTLDKYRKENLTDDAIRDFFATGENQVGFLLRTIRDRLDEGFAPESALDFGCGVGRVLLALAGACRSVVGVDVAESMLAEARSRCERLGLSNVRLVRGDDDLSRVEGRFDLVHSFIVLQHIPRERGEKILGRLLELLNDRGVGVLHLTYARRDDPGPAAPPGRRRPAVERTLRRLARTLRDSALRVLRGLRPGGARPRMQMNEYDLNVIFKAIQEAGGRRIHVEFCDHGGTYGVMLFFQKTPDAGYLI